MFVLGIELTVTSKGIVKSLNPGALFLLNEKWKSDNSGKPFGTLVRLREVESLRFRKANKFCHLLVIRLLVYTIQTVAAVLGKEFSNRFICRKHEFFNNLMGKVSL